MDEGMSHRWMSPQKKLYFPTQAKHFASTSFFLVAPVVEPSPALSAVAARGPSTSFLHLFFLPLPGNALLSSSQSPLSNTAFYNTNDISRYFNMMQYIPNLSWERLSWDFCDKNAVCCVFATKMTYYIFFAKKNGQLKVQGIVLFHQLPRIPNSPMLLLLLLVHPSQKASSGDISGIKRGIIDPLVWKRPEKSK